MKGGMKMTTLAIHPIAYLKEHVHYPHIINKLLKLVILIGFTIFLVGVLYSRLSYINITGREVVKQSYANAFPSEMPKEIIDQLVY